jgi:inner membrane protein
MCAIVPDIDVLCFKLGISYGSFWGHRGFLHSIFFAFLFGFATTAFLYSTGKISKKDLCFYGIYYSLVTTTHGVLDAFTNGGLGIALLSPFDNHRYFFWTTPISVSPLNPRVFLTGRGFQVLANELFWVWVPMLFLASFGKLTLYRKNKSQYQMTV